MAMCGIAGFTWEDRALLKQMTDLLEAAMVKSGAMPATVSVQNENSSDWQ